MSKLDFADPFSWACTEPPLSADAVPLPHGTRVEVLDVGLEAGRSDTTKAFGRVVALEGSDIVQVRIEGGGCHRFARTSLRPRDAGELRHAQRRARVETALSGCRILESVVGSRAWGLADEDSDVDTRGVFLWPFDWASSGSRVPDVVVSADGSHTLWEWGRTIDQALRADPNTLEMLWVPEVQVVDPIGAQLLAARQSFVSKRIYGSFGRYAVAQAKKLRKSLRLAKMRPMVLTWLREDPDLDLSQVAAKLAREVTLGGEEVDVQRSHSYVKQLYRSLFDQGVIAANDFDQLRELATHGTHAFELPRELRPKNAYNLLRVVSCAVQWLRTGEPMIEVEGELKDRLLAIKSQAIALDQILAWTEASADELERAHVESDLPAEPDFTAAEALRLAGREAGARRWFDDTTGPWSRHESPALITEGETT